MGVGTVTDAPWPCLPPEIRRMVWCALLRCCGVRTRHHLTERARPFLMIERLARDAYLSLPVVPDLCRAMPASRARGVLLRHPLLCATEDSACPEAPLLRLSVDDGTVVVRELGSFDIPNNSGGGILSPWDDETPPNSTPEDTPEPSAPPADQTVEMVPVIVPICRGESDADDALCLVRLCALRSGLTPEQRRECLRLRLDRYYREDLTPREMTALYEQRVESVALFMSLLSRYDVSSSSRATSRSAPTVPVTADATRGTPARPFDAQCLLKELLQMPLEEAASCAWPSSAEFRDMVARERPTVPRGSFAEYLLQFRAVVGTETGRAWVDGAHVRCQITLFAHSFNLLRIVDGAACLRFSN